MGGRTTAPSRVSRNGPTAAFQAKHARTMKPTTPLASLPLVAALLLSPGPAQATTPITPVQGGTLILQVIQTGIQVATYLQNLPDLGNVSVTVDLEELLLENTREAGVQYGNKTTGVRWMVNRLDNGTLRYRYYIHEDGGWVQKPVPILDGIVIGNSIGADIPYSQRQYQCTHMVDWHLVSQEKIQGKLKFRVAAKRPEGSPPPRSPYLAGQLYLPGNLAPANCSPRDPIFFNHSFPFTLPVDRSTVVTLPDFNSMLMRGSEHVRGLRTTQELWAY